MTPYDLIAMGWYLFPVANKMPLVKWTKESSNDQAQIKKWEALRGRTGWGVDCGKSDLAVLDIDSGKVSGALSCLYGLEFEYGELPGTFTVRTPSGGYHRIFRGAIRNSASTKLGSGLDTRGAGGFIVAPGSPGYDVIDAAEIAPVPDWLVDLVGRPVDRKEREPSAIEYDKPSAIEQAAAYLLEAEPAIEGLGGDLHTFRVACRVRDYGVSSTTALELMLVHWNDTCSPPWAPEELEVKIRNAYEYAQSPPGNANAENVFDEFEDAAPPTASRFKLLTSKDVDKFAPLSWRLKGIIPSRGVFQIYGPRSSGKSFLTLDMLAAIAEGRDWFSRKTKATTVVYVCLEGEAGLRQRKDAWELHNGRRLPDNFYMLAQPWSIITRKDIADLAGIIPKGSVVVIDTQNRAAPSINESASEDMGQVIEGAKILERLIEGAVGLVAHTGKDTTKGVRGHSSQEAAMDAVIEVMRLGETRKWKTAKVKDGSDGEEGAFALKVIKVGEDEDGDDITSCVIEIAAVEDVDGQGFNLSEGEAVAWASIKMLASASKLGGVTNTLWQDDFKEQMPRAGKNRFAAERDKLIEKKLVAQRDGLYVINALIPFSSENCPF